MAASELLQIPLEDHLIITEKDYFSFADYGFLHRPPNGLNHHHTIGFFATGTPIVAGDQFLLSPLR